METLSGRWLISGHVASISSGLGLVSCCCSSLTNGTCTINQTIVSCALARLDQEEPTNATDIFYKKAKPRSLEQWSTWQQWNNCGKGGMHLIGKAPRKTLHYSSSDAEGEDHGPALTRDDGSHLLPGIRSRHRHQQARASRFCVSHQEGRDDVWQLRHVCFQMDSLLLFTLI